MATAEKQRGFIIAALLLGILMGAMDNTIVSTALSTIVGELGGLDQLVWITSAYMIASVAATPIFGKLSDMYGRKRFFLLGSSIFIIGSILCGMSQSITQLAIFRAIQGIGGGALMPLAFTVMFDSFPAEQRGKLSGLFGAVFGLSSVLGPLLGAYITDYISWRWIFYINIPLGLISIGLIVRYYHESMERSKQKVDWLGAFTLVAAILALMFALELGGKQYAWDSAVIIGMFIAFALLLSAFLYIESKVAEPIISFSLFKDRAFAMSQATGFFYGAVFILGTIFIPIFVSGVYGGSATKAGLVLMPLMIGVVMGSQIGGRSVMKFSFKQIMLVSIGLLSVGSVLLTTISAETDLWVLRSFMVVTGMGVGMSFPVLSMASVQNIAPQHRGIANSANVFFRSVGMTIGISIYGTIQSNVFTNRLTEQFPNASSFGSQSFLDEAARANIPAPVLKVITSTLADSIATMFLWSLLPVALAFVCIAAMDGTRLLPKKQ